MKKAVSLALAFLLLLPCLSLAGCGRQEQGGQDDARVITDMAGRTVELPLEVERIACQSSTCEAVIISLGKATKLVGTTDYTDESSFAFQLFPELSQVTKLADDMSVEEMLEKMADYYDEEVEMTTQSVLAAMEPIIILFMALIIGTLVIAVIKPIASMYSGLDNL